MRLRGSRGGLAPTGNDGVERGRRRGGFEAGLSSKWLVSATEKAGRRMIKGFK